MHTTCLLHAGNPVPDMTYNVFGGTLSLTQSINQQAGNKHNGMFALTHLFINQTVKADVLRR